MNNFKEAELKQLLPSLERMLLRAPEALLGGKLCSNLAEIKECSI